MQELEGTFDGELGEQLCYRIWTSNKPKFNFVITHGQAEHSGSYRRLADSVTDYGGRVLAWDLLGHGRSEGKRGFAPNFHHYIADYGLFLQHIDRQNMPTFFFAHSMGGLIQTRYLCNHPETVMTAQILSAPWFGLAKKIPEWKRAGAEWVYAIAPDLTLFNEIDSRDMTRDLSVQAEFEKDPLRHDRISAGVYVGALRSISEVDAMASRIKTPTLLMMSDADPQLSTPRALEVFEKFSSTDKQKILFPGRGHEIVNDLGRDEVFAELKKFILSRIQNG